MNRNSSEISDEDLRIRLSRILGSVSAIPPVTNSTRKVLLLKLKKMEDKNPKGTKVNAEVATTSTTAQTFQPSQKSPPWLKSIIQTPPSSCGETESFKNIVFFDLEATGLRGSTPNPRITELSLVSVSVAEMEKLHRKLKKFKSENRTTQGMEQILPRVTNKLTVCFYPSVRMSFSVCELTGLDNRGLEGQKRFSHSSAMLVNHFLGHLEGSTCLVAHNGFAYDFPLLKSEFNKVGVDLTNEDITLVDSLIAFRQIYDEEKESVETEVTVSRELDELGHFEPLENSDEIARYFQPSEEIAPSSKRHKSDEKPELQQQPNNLDAFLEFNSEDSNEGTPDKQLIPSLKEPPKAPKRVKKSLVSHSSRVCGRNSRAAVKARKRLDFNQPPSFSLPRLHEHIFSQEPEVSHGAEQDCLALMRICAYKWDKFYESVNKQSKKNFSEVSKMW